MCFEGLTVANWLGSYNVMFAVDCGYFGQFEMNGMWQNIGSLWVAVDLSRFDRCFFVFFWRYDDVEEFVLLGWY